MIAPPMASTSALPHAPPGVGLTNMDATQRAKSSYILLFQVGRGPVLSHPACWAARCFGGPRSRNGLPEPMQGCCLPSLEGGGQQRASNALWLAQFSDNQLRLPPPPTPHPGAQAPLLPELILTAGGAEALRDTFCAPPAGVCNPGVMGEGDVAWYREAMLKPGVRITSGRRIGGRAVWGAMGERRGGAAGAQGNPGPHAPHPQAPRLRCSTTTAPSCAP